MRYWYWGPHRRSQADQDISYPNYRKIDINDSDLVKKKKKPSVYIALKIFKRSTKVVLEQLKIYGVFCYCVFSKFPAA